MPNLNIGKTKLIWFAAILLLVIIGSELIIVHQKRTPQRVSILRPTLSQGDKEKIHQNQIRQKRAFLVDIKTNGFSPAKVNLALGGVVTWKNSAAKECWLTGYGWHWPIRHPLKKGGHFSQEFDRPGQFVYGCRGWPIKGIINVH